MSPKKGPSSYALDYINKSKIVSFSRFNVTKTSKKQMLQKINALNWNFFNLWRHKSTGVRLSIKSRCEMQHFLILKTIYSLASFFVIRSASIPVTTCHSRNAHKKKKCLSINGVRMQMDIKSTYVAAVWLGLLHDGEMFLYITEMMH